MPPQDWFEANAPKGDWFSNPPPQGPHPEAKIGPDPLASPRHELKDGRIEPTYDEFARNPREGVKWVVDYVKEQAADPRNWLTLAAMYFGPKVVNAAIPAMANGAQALGAKLNDVAVPAIQNADPDLVSIASPRAGAILRKAQTVANRMGGAEPAPHAPTAEGYDRYAPNVSAPPALTPEQLAAQAGSGHALPPPDVARPVSGPQGFPGPPQGPEASIRAAQMREATRPAPLTEAQMGRGQQRPAAAASGESVSTTPSLTTAKTETIQGLLDRWAARASVELTGPERDTAVALVRQGAKPSEVIDAIVQHRSGASARISAEDAAAKLMEKWGLSPDPETGGPQHARGITGKWKGK